MPEPKVTPEAWSPPTAKETTHIRALPINSGAESPCCAAPTAHDATRTYCLGCNRVVGDLNDAGVADGVYYCCPDCGGAGDLDDVTRCDTCDGDGMVKG